MKFRTAFSSFIALLYLTLGCRTEQGVETNSDTKTLIPILQVKKFDSMAGKLAITIDDGPGAGTETVVNWIQNWNLTHTDNPIKVTMFLTAKGVGTSSAKWTYYNDHIAKDPNFLLGNHTYEHNMTRFGWQIKTAHEALHGLLPQNAVRFFRAPGGAPVTAARQADAKASLPRDIDYVGGIFWDIGGVVSGSRSNPTGSADWSCWNARTPPVMSLDTCLTGYQRETTRKNGGVVLFHDITTKSGMLIPRYLEWAAARYKFVRLDEIDALYRMARTVVGPPAADGSDTGIPPLSAVPIPAPNTPPTPRPNTPPPSDGNTALDALNACTQTLKGACMIRQTCLEIGAASTADAGQWNTRYRNSSSLLGMHNLELASGQCPNSPANVRCCYSPSVSGGTGLTAVLLSPMAVAEESLPASDSQSVSRRATAQGRSTCTISRNDFASRHFYLFSHLQRSVDKNNAHNHPVVAECAPNVIRSVFKQAATPEQMKEGLNLAKRCFKFTAILDLVGHSDDDGKTIADFKLTGTSMEEDPSIGDVQFQFSPQNQTIIAGDIVYQEARPWVYRAKERTGQLDINQNSADSADHHDEDHENIGHNFPFSFKLTNGEQWGDPCAMRWGGNMKLSDSEIIANDSQDFEYFLTPANNY